MQTIFLHKIKWYKLFLVFCVLVIQTLFINQVFAQEVQVNLQHPPYNQLKIEHLWNLTLTYTPIDTTQEILSVYLYGTLTESEAGLIATGTSTTIQLPPGVKTYTAANYQELDPQIDYRSSDPKYEESVMRTGGLPSGDYEICVYVRLVSNNNNIGDDCIQQNIEMMPAPSLISPDDGDALVNKNPVFTWMHAVKPRVEVSYKIKIVEIYSPEDPYTAMQNNPAWFEEANIRTTVFQYPVSAREFPDSGMYAWQVTALDPSGNTLGESKVWSFAVQNVYQPVVVTNFDMTCSNQTGQYDFTMEVANYNTQGTIINSCTITDNAIITSITITPIPSGCGLPTILTGPFSVPTGSPLTITGSITTTCPITGVNLEIISEDDNCSGAYATALQTNLSVEPCTCCGDFIWQIGPFSYDTGGWLNINITAGPNPITKVTAELVYFSVIRGNPDCNTCVKESEQWGNFCAAKNIPGFNDPVLTTIPGLSQCSREVTWLSTSTDGSDLSGGAELNMQTGFPPASTLDCCPDIIELCIRFSFTDNLCVPCDTLLCITIERTNNNVTIVSNTLHDLYENNLGVRNVLLAMGTTDTDNSWFGELTGSALNEFGLNLGKTTDYPTYSVNVPKGNSTDLSGGARLRSPPLLAYNGGWSGQFDSDSPDGILPETDAGSVGFLIPPPQPPVTVTITSDNAYVYGFGTETEITAYGDPGVANPSRNEIIAANMGTETYTIPASFAGGYIYIAAWSDEDIWQGLIAEFTDGITTVLTSPTQSNPDVNWEVYATGLNLDPNWGTDPMPIATLWTPRRNFNAPTLNEINDEITRANGNNGSLATTSIGWVSTIPDPSCQNSTGDPCVGVLAFGPNNALNRNPFPVVVGINPAAQWMWYNPNPNAPNAITDPFDTGPIPDFPAAQSREYYIFRIGPIDVFFPGDECCDEFDINVTSDEITDLGDGEYQIIPELIAGPNKITKFSATLEYVNVSYNNPECEVCADNSDQFGNLSVDPGQVFTEGGTTLTPALTGPTNLDINWSREVIWQDWGDDGSVDLTGGFSPEIQLKFPPPSPISCCEQTIEFCIRYEFTDENCVTCDTLICYEIPPPVDRLCECGEWTDPPQVDYTIGSGKIIFPGSATCGETVRLFMKGQKISISNFTGDFTCKGDANCLAEYTWELTDPSGTLIKGGSGKNINVNFRASKYGEYTLIIQPICGSKECPPCEITFYVTTIQLPPLEKEKE